MGGGGSGFRPIAPGRDGIAEQPLDGICRTGYLNVSGIISDREREMAMRPLEGFEKKYLRGLAHGLKPVVFIGRQGMTAAVAQSVDDALDRHELIKVKFVDFKEKAQKETIRATIEEKTNAQSAGIIGHTAIFYRQHHDPEKRTITLPKRRG